MDGDQKTIVAVSVCVALTLFAIVSCAQYSDMWHVSQGFEWVPQAKGHWVKR